METRSPGLLREESRGSLEDLHVAAQPLVLPPQGGQLVAFGAGQPAITAAPGIAFGLADPFADRGLGQVEVAGDLPDRAVTALAQLHDLGLELGRERPTHARLLAFHGLHDGHPPRGSTPDVGCPSNRVRPIRGRPRAAIRRTRLSAPAPSSEEDSTPPPEPAGMHMQPWDLGTDQAPRSLT